MSTYINMLGGSNSGGNSGEETDPIFSASEAVNFETGDKDKLDGIEDNANNYTLEDHASTHHSDGDDSIAPADIGAESSLGNPDVDGKILSSTSEGVRSWISPPLGEDAVTSTTVTAIVVMTQAAYDILDPIDPTVLYILDSKIMLGSVEKGRV